MPLMMPTSSTKPRKGEIWDVNFDPSIGDEIRKIRPALVVNENELGRLRLHIVVPITDWKERYERYPWFIRLDPSQQNGLDKISGADAFQIKSVSADRFIRKRGVITNNQLKDVLAAIALCIGYEP